MCLSSYVSHSGASRTKMPFTFYCDLSAGLPHFPHRCQTFPSMPRNMIRWWQRRNRPWQHMAPFQENRFRHNIHVEAMKFIRPREDLKHRRTIRAQIIPSREYVMTGLSKFFHWHFAPDRRSRRSLGARFVFRMYTQN